MTDTMAGLTDIFENPFDFDDPRIEVARVLTRTEAKAVLDFDGDIVQALAAQPSAGGQGEDAELEADMERDLTESDHEAIERGLRTIRAFDAVRDLRSVLSDTLSRQHNGYDWNADPDGMTLRQSEAIQQADRVNEAGPAQPDTGDVAALREALGQIKDEIRFVSDPEDVTLAVIEGIVEAALSTANTQGGAS